MVTILLNLVYFAVWLGLTGALTVGVSRLSQDNPSFGGGLAVVTWLVGELIILSPILRIAWRDRRLDFES